MTRLVVLDVLFTIFHLLIIAFNLFGWIFQSTRKIHFWFAMLTLACWTILGLKYGLGYCPVTDWHWAIKTQLGEQNLPNSFIKYFTDRFIGIDVDTMLIDSLTAALFFVAIICSVKVNFFRRKTKNQ